MWKENRMFLIFVTINLGCSLATFDSISSTRSEIKIKDSPYRAHVLSKRLIETKDNLSLPKFSEEEENSMFPADHLTCPSCQAIAFQFHIAFSAAHKYNNERLTDSELLDVTCRS